MRTNFSSFYDERSIYIIDHLINAIPRYKVWYQEDNIYKFKFIESTFPEYVRFAYTKKPKYWRLLDSREKKKHDRYWQLNTKGVVDILRKSLSRKKLTKWQGDFLEELFGQFNDYEKMMLIEYDTELF